MLVKRKSERDKSIFISYDDLKIYVRLNKIRTKSNYLEHLKVKRESNGYIIPYNPSSFYNDYIWQGWSVFLRDEIYKKKYKGLYYDFLECKKSIDKYNFLSKSDFFKRIGQIIKEDIRIPYNPSKIYNNEWKGWVDFLNTDNDIERIENLVEFDVARSFARSLELKMKKQWNSIKFSQLPKGMTKKPDILYKNRGWIDWLDFLGISEKSKMSYGELLISNILDAKNIKYIYNKSLKDCISSSKLRFDFYLPDYNICIEYDGKQHFFPMDYFGGEYEFEKIKIRDNIKNEWCSINDINLCRVNYTQSEYDIKKIIEKIIE
jgi:hypothetical protein